MITKRALGLSAIAVAGALMAMPAAAQDYEVFAFYAADGVGNPGGAAPTTPNETFHVAVAVRRLTANGRGIAASDITTFIDSAQVTGNSGYTGGNASTCAGVSFPGFLSNFSCGTVLSAVKGNITPEDGTNFDASAATNSYVLAITAYRNDDPVLNPLTPGYESVGAVDGIFVSTFTTSPTFTPPLNIQLVGRQGQTWLIDVDPVPVSPGVFDTAVVGGPTAAGTQVPILDDPLLAVLSSFEASSAGVGNSVNVTWSTSEEVDNVGFEVYRAEHNGFGYTVGSKISGLVPAAGTASDYSFVDAEPLRVGETRAYYLTDIDINGVSTLHGPVVATVLGGEGASSVPDWALYDF
jgi:hypothetical protein